VRREYPTTVCSVINNTESKCLVTNNTFYPTIINQCNATDILSRVKEPGEILISVCDKLSNTVFDQYVRYTNCYPPETKISDFARGSQDSKAVITFNHDTNPLVNHNRDFVTIRYKGKGFSFFCVRGVGADCVSDHGAIKVNLVRGTNVVVIVFYPII
jgi:hypothetical protein